VSTTAALLLVDDQPDRRTSLAGLLRTEGYSVQEAGSLNEGLDALHAGRFDAVIGNGRLNHESSGLHLLRHVKAHTLDVEVILVTAGSTLGDGGAGTSVGDLAYVTLPTDRDRFLETVQRATTRGHAVRLVEDAIAIDGIVAVDPATRTLMERALRLAAVDATVLITGETGTGKEVIANLLCRHSKRTGPFVPVNCGGLPESLVESELFGHLKGTFTGAALDRKGLVEQAHRGMLFLDEIGEMPLAMQVRLLRFLDSGEVRPVGATTTKHVDVRVIAATNRDLEDDIEQGRFRQDLFYRLRVASLHIPSLRQRKGDIEPLAYTYLRRVADRLGKNVRGFSDDAVTALQEYEWPGNVRELKNVVNGAVSTAMRDVITAADLFPERRVRCGSAAAVESSRYLTGRDLFDALARFKGNQSLAAKALGISRTTLWRRMRQYAE
jgi:DNA-binding NtrC family response regulator